jgi:nitroimidazol reductase NimA-like FMN-containing flavoprotein (pyridoxamine 5'-phosphate oxidase superfamily)
MLGCVQVDRNGLEILDRHTCLLLLAGCSLGRIGCTSAALPIVLPVNFRLIGESIVIRTSEGTKLESATAGTVVAFEVDEFDVLSHTGWSVLVTGFAREVTNPFELDALDVERNPRRTPSGAEHVVAISTDIVSGRRIVHQPATAT